MSYASQVLAGVFFCVGKLVISGEPTAQFDATASGGMKIAGVTHEVDDRDEGDKIVVTVPLADLDTGIAVRNQHLREKYLETAQYPNAELTIPRSAIQFPPEGGTAKDVSVSGEMKLHG